MVGGSQAQKAQEQAQKDQEKTTVTTKQKIVPKRETAKTFDERLADIRKEISAGDYYKDANRKTALVGKIDKLAGEVEARAKKLEAKKNKSAKERKTLADLNETAEKIRNISMNVDQPLKKETVLKVMDEQFKAPEESKLKNVPVATEKQAGETAGERKIRETSEERRAREEKEAVESMRTKMKKSEDSELGKNALVTILSLEKGLQPSNKITDFSKLELLMGAKSQEEIEKVLRSYWDEKDYAKFYAEKIWNDEPFRKMIASLGGDPKQLLASAKELTQRMYFIYDNREIAVAIDNLEKYAKKGEKESRMLNFLVSKMYGDIKDIAKRIDDFYKENKIKKSTGVTNKDDETATLIKVLTTIKNDEKYLESLKNYRDTSGPTNLENLSIIGKFAFLRITYPELLKNYGSGDVNRYADFLSKNSIPSQLEFITFSEVIPYMAKDNRNPMDKLILASAMIGLWGYETLNRSGWNMEKQLYEYGVKMLESAVKRTERDFLKVLMNRVLIRPSESDPSNKLQYQIKDTAFEQWSPTEATSREITSFLERYAPLLKNELDMVLNVQGVRDPENIVRAFRKLMEGQDLGVILGQKGRISLGLELDLDLFGRYLNELNKWNPVPNIFDRWGVKGGGNYSYRATDKSGQEDKTSTGSMDVIYSKWGPVGNFSIYGSLLASNNNPAFKLGSAGERIYGLGGSEVRYKAEGLTSSEIQQIDGYIETFKGDANTLVHLKLIDNRTSDMQTQYEATIYRKQGSEYYKITSHKFSGDEAASIFGGYAGFKGDARMLFKEGSLKGLVLGYQFNEKIGAAALTSSLKDRDQFSAMVAVSGNQIKVGGRVYTDTKGAKQLGLTALSPRTYISAAGGTQKVNENESTVYALNLKAQLSNTKIAIMASKLMDTILAGGFQSENAYFLLDYWDRMSGSKDFGLMTGWEIPETGFKADIWAYSNLRTALFAYTSDFGVGFTKLIRERELLSAAISKGDVDTAMEKMKWVTGSIDYLRTVTGEQIRRAIKVSKRYDGARIEAEQIGGASEMINFMYYGAGKTPMSYSLAGSVGETSSARYLQVKRAEDGMASMAAAQVLSIDELSVLSGRYGRTTTPVLAPDGKGFIVGADVGNNLQQAVGGVYTWYEPYAELKRSYSAFIGKAGKDFSRDAATGNMNSFYNTAFGYGYTLKEYMRSGNRTIGGYAIIGGTQSDNDAKEKINTIMAELGIKLTNIEVTGESWAFTGGVRMIKIIADTNKGFKIEAYAIGDYQQQVR